MLVLIAVTVHAYYFVFPRTEEETNKSSSISSCSRSQINNNSIVKNETVEIIKLVLYNIDEYADDRE